MCAVRASDMLLMQQVSAHEHLNAARDTAHFAHHHEGQQAATPTQQQADASLPAFQPAEAQCASEAGCPADAHGSRQTAAASVSPRAHADAGMGMGALAPNTATAATASDGDAALLEHGARASGRPERTAAARMRSTRLGSADSGSSGAALQGGDSWDAADTAEGHRTKDHGVNTTLGAPAQCRFCSQVRPVLIGGMFKCAACARQCLLVTHAIPQPVCLARVRRGRWYAAS